MHIFIPKRWFTISSRNCFRHQSRLTRSVNQTSSQNTDVLCIVWIMQLHFRGWSGVLEWGGRGRHVKLCLGCILWYKPNHNPASAAVRCASPWTTDHSPRDLLTDNRDVALSYLTCLSRFSASAQSATVPLPASREERVGYHELSGCYVPGLWSLRTVRTQSFSVHQHFTGKQDSTQLNLRCTTIFIDYITNEFAMCLVRVGQVVTFQ